MLFADNKCNLQLIKRINCKEFRLTINIKKINVMCSDNMILEVIDYFTYPDSTIINNVSLDLEIETKAELLRQTKSSSGMCP